MAKLDKNRLASLEREEELRWLEMYIRQADGLAALAEAYAEGCETEWMAMQFGLESLVKLMREDLDQKRKEIENA